MEEETEEELVKPAHKLAPPVPMPKQTGAQTGAPKLPPEYLTVHAFGIRRSEPALPEWNWRTARRHWKETGAQPGAAGLPAGIPQRRYFYPFACTKLPLHLYPYIRTP
jgi:hypothetical protein